jgi:hypothetical protein
MILSMWAFLLNVRLTGARPLWQELIGPALLALTAIAAAAIAARTANRRQGQQLRDNRELQTELQRQQLAYDREQRDRQHVRDTVDEAVRGMESAVRGIASYESAVKQQSAELIKDRAGKAAEIVNDLIVQTFRIDIRLGQSHPITQTHSAFSDAFSARRELVKSLEVQGEEVDQQLASNEVLASAAAAFLAACRDWFQGVT